MTAAAKTIHQRLALILGELPPLGKDKKNEQQRFMFRSFDSMLNALNPLMAKHGVLVVPAVLERVTELRKTKSGSTMYEVNLHVQFTFYGEGGDSVVCSTWGEGTDLGDKATSKAHTMALKTALNQVLAISSEEFNDPDGGSAEESSRSAAGGTAPREASKTADAEATASGPAKAKEPSPADDKKQEKKLTTPQRKMLFARAREKGLGEGDLKLLVADVTGKTSSKDLTKSDLDKLLKWLDEYERPEPEQGELA